MAKTILTSLHGKRLGLGHNDELIHGMNGLYSVSGMAEATVTSAQVLALSATAISVVPAPGAGVAVVPYLWAVHKPAGTAYAGVAAGEDLVLKYTDASGAAASGIIETTGFLDQTTLQTRIGLRSIVSPLATAPVANAPIVLHLLVGEITTGDSDLHVRVWYHLIETVF